MCLRVLMLITLLLASPGVLAQAEKVGGLYKWTDDEGRVHYTDTPPPEASDEERTVLNKQGLPVEVLAAEKTPEQLAAEKRAREQAAEEARLAARQAERDHALLSTYTSVSDIEQARDSRLQAIEAKIRVASGNIDNLEGRVIEMEKRAAQYKQSKGNVPPYISEQLEDARTQLLDNQRYLMARRSEQDKVRAEYAKDIARFKELKKEE